MKFDKMVKINKKSRNALAWRTPPLKGKSMRKAIEISAGYGNLEAQKIMKGKHPIYKPLKSAFGEPDNWYIRRVRLEGTLPEQRLKDILDEMGHQEGVDYFLQYPISSYLLDFAFPSLRLDIEADGQYWHESRKDQDQKRDVHLKNCGWTVLRFNEKDLEDVKHIKDSIQRWVSKLRRNSKFY
jgi:very-short-patch-repair endonuclease